MRGTKEGRVSSDYGDENRHRQSIAETISSRAPKATAVLGTPAAVLLSLLSAIVVAAESTVARAIWAALVALRRRSAHTIACRAGLGAVQTVALQVAWIAAVSTHALLARLRRKPRLGGRRVGGRAGPGSAGKRGARPSSYLTIAKGLQVVVARDAAGLRRRSVEGLAGLGSVR